MMFGWASAKAKSESVSILHSRKIGFTDARRQAQVQAIGSFWSHLLGRCVASSPSRVLPSRLLFVVQ